MPGPYYFLIFAIAIPTSATAYTSSTTTDFSTTPAEFSTLNPSPKTCCQFESAAVCGWTPYFTSDGWYWSGYLTPRETVPPHSGYFIWAEDLSTTVESTPLPGVTDGTTISFDYYLVDEAELEQNVYFQNGQEPVLLGVLDVKGQWATFSYTCEASVVCSDGRESCAGKISIVTQNKPAYHLVLAIDVFNVDDGCQAQIPGCCQFNTPEMCYWDLFYTSTGWHWSPAFTPPLPVPDPGSPYIFAADESAIVESTPMSGITSDTVFSIKYYFFTENEYATNSLTFLFETNTTSAELKTISQSDDTTWHNVDLPCTSECCQPGETCDGKFVVSLKTAPGNQEVAAIDDFLTNGACIPTSTTPSISSTISTTPTPPPPQEWCCTFESPEVCQWSLYYVSTGWLWSGHAGSSIYIPDGDSDYIFVEDDSATVSCPMLSDIDSGATFGVDYYFSSDAYDALNKLTVTFENEFGYTGTLEESMPHYDNWTTATFTCGTDCCKGGTAPCNLQIVFTTTNAPMIDLVAAIDNFSANGAKCA